MGEAKVTIHSCSPHHAIDPLPSASAAALRLCLSYAGMNSFHSQYLENSQNLMCKHNDSVIFLDMTVNSNKKNHMMKG